MSKYLSFALIIIAGVLGTAFGYFLTPYYQQSMYVKEVMDLGAADRWLDLRYVNAMIAHHRSAMLLAQQAKDVSERNEIRNLSHDILKNEPKLIDELYAFKSNWYQDTSPVSDPTTVRLGDYSQNFDLRFLNALIAHHEAGIAMTQEVRLKSSRAQVLDNADAVEAFLTQSLTTLKQWREDWY